MKAKNLKGLFSKLSNYGDDALRMASNYGDDALDYGLDVAKYADNMSSAPAGQYFEPFQADLGAGFEPVSSSHFDFTNAVDNRLGDYDTAYDIISDMRYALDNPTSAFTDYTKSAYMPRIRKLHENFPNEFAANNDQLRDLLLQLMRL